METLLSIAHWNKKTFNTSEKEQRDKVKEEFEEYMQDPSSEELADTLIAILGLARHCKMWKQLFFAVLALGTERYTKEEIYNAVILKMEINRKRIWLGSHHIL